MKLLKRALAPIAAAAMIAGSMHASAATSGTWLLNVYGGGGDPGTGPWGQVDANVVNANDVNVTVTLYTTPLGFSPAPTVGFVNTGDHSAFTFSLSDTTGVTIENLTAGFAAGPNPATNASFGTFTNGITCVVCGSGASTPYAGPPALSFTIRDSGGINQDLNSLFIFSTLPPGDKLSLFASDIFTTTGVTGTVGVGTPAIPEPETYAMMLVGFGLLGFVARRRKQSLGNLASA